jgi:peptidoglycan hydrolase CwlO-like protein
MQVDEMKSRLEDKIRALEKEKAALLEEVKQLKEVVELSEKAKSLESEVDKLREEVKALKNKIPREFLQELREVASTLLEEDEEKREECQSCNEEEELL